MSQHFRNISAILALHNLALHPPSFNLENYQATLPYKCEYEYFLLGGVPAVIFKETSGVLTHWNNSKSFV